MIVTYQPVKMTARVRPAMPDPEVPGKGIEIHCCERYLVIPLEAAIELSNVLTDLYERAEHETEQTI